MNIPLNDLYHYLAGVFDLPVYLYEFYPHGSRSIYHLRGVTDLTTAQQQKDPVVICNDQEPLNYELYQDHSQETIEKFFRTEYKHLLYDRYRHVLKNSNLRLGIGFNIFDKVILIHSEKNSNDLELYQANNFVGLYYWAHAFIARDWYRFAEHDKRLEMPRAPKTIFLIYCREWSGTREYRLKFQELLVEQNLHANSITSIKKTNDNTAADEHVFRNKKLVPNNFEFLEKLADNYVGSGESAAYDPKDFVDTKISVVLETIFDGSKIHLTEKILRPIACGHPFILAAGPGSLAYLREYGFKTFDPWIDESYDQETDSVIRLEKIIKSMKQFSDLPCGDQEKIYKKIVKIAEHNREWFFSKKFMNLINQELATNAKHAVSEVLKTRGKIFLTRNKSRAQNFIEFNKENRKTMVLRLRQLRKLNSKSS